MPPVVELYLHNRLDYNGWVVSLHCVFPRACVSGMSWVSVISARENSVNPVKRTRKTSLAVNVVFPLHFLSFSFRIQEDESSWTWHVQDSTLKGTQSEPEIPSTFQFSCLGTPPNLESLNVQAIRNIFIWNSKFHVNFC